MVSRATALWCQTRPPALATQTAVSNSCGLPRNACNCARAWSMSGGLSNSTPLHDRIWSAPITSASGILLEMRLAFSSARVSAICAPVAPEAFRLSLISSSSTPGDAVSKVRPAFSRTRRRVGLVEARMRVGMRAINSGRFPVIASQPLPPEREAKRLPLACLDARSLLRRTRGVALPRGNARSRRCAAPGSCRARCCRHCIRRRRCGRRRCRGRQRPAAPIRRDGSPAAAPRPA